MTTHDSRTLTVEGLTGQLLDAAADRAGLSAGAFAQEAIRRHALATTGPIDADPAAELRDAELDEQEDLMGDDSYGQGRAA